MSPFGDETSPGASDLGAAGERTESSGALLLRRTHDEGSRSDARYWRISSVSDSLSGHGATARASEFPHYSDCERQGRRQPIAARKEFFLERLRWKKYSI